MGFSSSSEVRTGACPIFQGPTLQCHKTASLSTQKVILSWSTKPGLMERSSLFQLRPGGGANFPCSFETQQSFYLEENFSLQMLHS